MRYKINFPIRQLLKQNHRKLLNTSIKTNLKNLIYVNKSISESQLNRIIKISKTSKKSLKLKEAEFHPERNFGKHLRSIRIKFKGRVPDFAEFIGIMLGDGNIYKNAIRITISSEEQEFKKHIEKLFKTLFGIKPKIYHSKISKSLSLYVYSKKLRMLLEKHGLGQGNKVRRNIQVPKWIKVNKTFSRYCIRGMIDTDGCTHYHKRDKQLYVSFHNRATNLLIDLQKMAKYFNLNFTRNHTYIVTLYKKDEIRKYINEIGFSNERHSSRAKKYLGL
jgi:intein/homing endonuclease